MDSKPGLDPGPPEVSGTLCDGFEHLEEMWVRDAAVRDHIFTALSHDLRTPVAVILGNCQLLMEGLSGPMPGTHAQKIEVIHRQASRLQQLMESLLDRHRDVLSVIPFHRHPCPLPFLLRAVLDDLESLARSRRQVVRVASPAVLDVQGDRVAFVVVLSAVLEHALRHAREGTGVDVALTTDADLHEAVLVVRIDGPPFPFTQLGAVSLQRSTHGFEVGMATRVLASLGGRMVHDNPDSGGARTTVVWPLTLPAAKSRAVRRGRVLGDGALDLLLKRVDDLRQRKSQSGAFGQIISVRSMPIVDDVFGEDAYEHVVQWLSGVLRICEQDRDNIFRVGCTFFILLPGAGPEEAQCRVASLRERLQFRQLRVGSRRLWVDVDLQSEVITEDGALSIL